MHSRGETNGNASTLGETTVQVTRQGEKNIVVVGARTLQEHLKDTCSASALEEIVHLMFALCVG